MNTHSTPPTASSQTNTLTATAVPNRQRLRFWPQHFGNVPQWLILEPHVFGWLDRLCTDYHGGSWNFTRSVTAGPLWLQKAMSGGHCLTV